jgi:SAM-dependent methyltransferase
MIDDRAARGFTAAEHYDAHRPSYPPAAVAFIREAARIDQQSTVVDLGAGTGLMTRLLSPVGRLIAVEPQSEMRETLRARVPEAEILDGTAEQIPLPPAVAHAVVAAQAFHWFANPQAVREIARVLRPDGTLILVWNERDPLDPLMEAVERALERHRQDSPRFDTTPWREVFDSADSPLTIIGHRTYPWEEPVTVHDLKGRVLSYSYIAVLGEQARTTVVHELGELAGIFRGIRTTDDAVLVLKHITEMYVARRR